MATVKPLLRNKLAPWAACGGSLTDGQLLPPRGLTSRQRCPTCTTGLGASRWPASPGGLHPPAPPAPRGQAASSAAGQASCSSSPPPRGCLGVLRRHVLAAPRTCQGFARAHATPTRAPPHSSPCNPAFELGQRGVAWCCARSRELAAPPSHGGSQGFKSPHLHPQTPQVRASPSHHRRRSRRPRGRLGPHWGHGRPARAAERRCPRESAGRRRRARPGGHGVRCRPPGTRAGQTARPGIQEGDLAHIW
jgi:hypothetical protein